MDPLQALCAEPVSALGPFELSSVSTDTRLTEAARRMQERKHGCVLVVDGERLAGIVTERDILFRIGASLPMDVPILESATPNVHSVRISDSVGRAILMMRDHHCRHLAIVDESDRPVGVLSVKRILRSLVERFPRSVYTLPPEANQVQTQPEGA